MTAYTPSAQSAASEIVDTIRRLPQEYERDVDLDSLSEWPKNPKDHDVGAIVASIEATGWYGVVYAQRSTRRILAGHGRKEALVQLNVSRVDVLWIECDDRTGARIVAADNRLVELGGYRDDLLLDFLRELQREDNMIGTGFDDDDITTLLARLDANDTSGEHDASDDEPAAPVFLIYPRDEIVEHAFAHFRASGFPYRVLSLHEQMQEVNRLAALDDDALVATTLAYQVADTYHPHRFAAAATGKRSPLQSFAIDTSLRKALTMQLDAGGRVTRDLAGPMMLVNGTQACANFRPGFATYLYRRYARAGARVLDPCTGYGGRLVGWIASRLGGTYTGVDPNVPTNAGNCKLASALARPLRGEPDPVTLYCAPFEDVGPSFSADAFDFVFTSPPYFAKERYSEDDTQSWVRYKTIDAWRDGFLRPLAVHCYRTLVPLSYCVINIADVKIKNVTYPLEAMMIEDALAAGFVHVETVDFDMPQRLGQGEQPDAREPALVFQKPSSGTSNNGKRSRAKSATSKKVGHADAASASSAAVVRDTRVDDADDASAAASGRARVDAKEPSKNTVTTELLSGVPVLEEHDVAISELRAQTIVVVRDDLLMGGTKSRYCVPLCAEHEHVVYASAAQGGAQLALAYAARESGHRATIFVAKRSELHARTLEAQRVGAVIEQVDPGYLAVVQKRARDFAREQGAYLVAFGGDSEDALNVIAAAASSVNDRAGPFDEVWCAVGSGVLIRGLQRGIPGARFFGLSVGRDVPQSQVDHASVTRAAVSFERQEKRETPFPSCPNYDRKAWFACVNAQRALFPQRGAKRVLFWNVIGPSPTPFAPHTVATESAPA